MWMAALFDMQMAGGDCMNGMNHATAKANLLHS